MRRRIAIADQGFTLIEVLVATTLLVIGVLGTVALVDTANSTAADTKAREAGTNLARELVEATRLVAYPKVTQDNLPTQIQGRAGLADTGAAAGWQVRRRALDYTVETTVCHMDDPNDAQGVHDSTFCADSPPDDASGADSNPKDYKRVRFVLRWRDGDRQRVVTQTTVLTPGGTADLPKVVTLKKIEPSPEQDSAVQPPVLISDPTPAASPPGTGPTKLKFHVKTSTVPAGVKWLRDGGVKGLATQVPGGDGTEWTFEWSIPDTGSAKVYDGTYSIGAEPYDASGAQGVVKEMPIRINRALPTAPAPFYAGWNRYKGDTFDNRLIDLEWAPNKEPDVIGYRVFRKRENASGNATATEEVTSSCREAGSTAPYTKKASCTFYPSDPFVLPNGVYPMYKYWVRAVDYDNQSTPQPREGPASIEIDAYQQPMTGDPDTNAPDKPTGLAASTDADGNRVLTWNKVASPETSKPGQDRQDKVLFYRIYRDGTARFSAGCPSGACKEDRTAFEPDPVPAGDPATRRWTDSLGGAAGPHCYYVTAVDARMRESQSAKIGVGGASC